MTKRKPLVWYESEYGATPDCDQCMDKMCQPGFAEACHSVAIESADSAATLARRYLDRFHADRHRP